MFLIFSHCPKYMPDIIFLTEILFERRSNIACLCYFRPPPHRVGVRTTDSGFYSQFMLLSLPHRIGVRTTDSDIYSQFMLLSPPSCEDNSILALSIAACEILLPLSIFAISSTRSSILRSVIVLVVPSAVSSFSTL